MLQKNPRRFVLIGLPGSGKSTFALLLGKTWNIPVHHLDRHVFEKGGKKRDREELLSIQRDMIHEEEWVIEGCSVSTLETRMARATDVLYFRFSRSLCLWRILKRIFVYDKALSETGCLRGINWQLLTYTWNFEAEKGEEIEATVRKYPHVRFTTFKTPQEAHQFLSSKIGL